MIIDQGIKRGCLILRSYNSKAVISGSQIEIYNYEKEIYYDYEGFNKKSVGRSVEASEENKELNREKVFSRARREVRRLVNCNYQKYSKFLTLTFAGDHWTDIKSCNYELKKFIQRLKYKYKYSIKYTAVPEIQEERYKKYGVEVWHYHLILYNVTEKINVEELQKIWGHGFIKINVIKNCDNVGAYISKYMTKSHKDLLKGEKMFFNSRGLIKPKEIKEPDLVSTVEKSLQNQTLKYENTFVNDYNKITYKQYIIEQ